MVVLIPFLEKRKHHRAGSPTLQSPVWAQPLPTLIAMGAGWVQFEKFFSALRRVKSSPFLHTVEVRNIVGSFVGFQQAYEQRSFAQM